MYNVRSRSSLGAILARNAAIKEAMSGVLALETALAALSARPPALESLVPYSIERLEKDFPFLRWRRFFSRAFRQLAGRDLESYEGELEVMVQVDFLKVSKRSISNLPTPRMYKLMGFLQIAFRASTIWWSSTAPLGGKESW